MLLVVQLGGAANGDAIAPISGPSGLAKCGHADMRTCGHAGQLWLSIDQTYLKSLSAVVLSHALANISILIFVYFHIYFIFSPFRTIFSAFHTIEVTSSSPHGTVK